MKKDLFDKDNLIESLSEEAKHFKKDFDIKLRTECEAKEKQIQKLLLEFSDLESNTKMTEKKYGKIVIDLKDSVEVLNAQIKDL